MARIKEKRESFHKALTTEVFYCLSYMPQYSIVLAQKEEEKPYLQFLQWLIKNNFFREQTEKISIKKIANDFKAEQTKVTKWIREIYDDIFELNYNRPELFYGEGIKVVMFFRYAERGYYFKTTFPSLPRRFETIQIPFVKAKVGVEYFYVKKVYYEIGNEGVETLLWLEIGEPNIYREFALDKAMFNKWINDADVYLKNDFALDNELRRLYQEKSEIRRGTMW